MSLFDRILTEGKKSPQRWNVEVGALLDILGLVRKAHGLAGAHSGTRGNKKWKVVTRRLGSIENDLKSLHKHTVSGMQNASKR